MKDIVLRIVMLLKKHDSRFGLPPHRHKMLEEYFKEVELDMDDGYSFQFPSKWESVGKLVEIITEERKNNPSVEFRSFSNKTKAACLQIKGEAAKDYVISLCLL